MDKIGKYEVLRKIGAGGFATVFEGRDPYLKRRVAIKTCATDSEDIRQRFYREAEIAGNLEHRNIVTVFDFGFEDTVPYLVQEYLPGEDLDHRMERREPFPTARKLEILEHIAAGLAYAHGQGVIHRDIKPGNVRLLEDGRVKIMDFGIARLQSIETRLTKAGMTVGTAAYLSPEQVRGEAGERQADVWAWGVLAYELLSGIRPFSGAGMADLLEQVLDQEPKPLAEVWTECPPRLASLVGRCLEKDPAKRYASFTQVLADLEPLVRASTAHKPAPATGDKEAAVDSSMDKTMRMSAEELQRLANEPMAGAGASSAAGDGEADANAITAETAARQQPSPGAAAATAAAAAVAETATRVLPAAGAAPASPPPAAAPDGGKTSVLAPLPDFPELPMPPPPPRAAPPEPARPTPEKPPRAAATVPPPAPPKPAAKAAVAAKPAPRPAAARRSPLPILIGVGALLLLAAAAAIFWFVVRPRLQARFGAAAAVESAAPAATSSAPGELSQPAVEERQTDSAPAPSKASVTIPAPSRPGMTVAIDGGPPIPLAAAMTIEMAPGDHLVVFSAPGALPETRQLTVEAGTAGEIYMPQLVDEPVAAPSPAARRPRRRVEPPPAPAPEPVAAPVVEAPPPPPPPPVRRGDLVEFGPGVVRPKLVKALSAHYPPAARKMKAEARIGVAVLVDENGRPSQLRIAEGDDRGLGFEEVALEAARAATFHPATKDGVPVKMWHTVYLSFRAR